MKKIITLSIFALICINANSQSFQWVKQMGSTGDDRNTAITTDASGNVITTGFFQGIVDFDPGAAILNLNSNDPTNHGMYIQKLDGNGNLLWVKQISPNNGTSWLVEGTSIITDATSNIYVTGWFSSPDSIDFDPGPGIFYLGDHINFVFGFVLKLDVNGNFIFAKQFTGPSLPTNITIDSTNNIYTTGYFSGIVDFDPSPSTSYNLNYSGLGTCYVSKLNQNGDFVWAKEFVALDSLDVEEFVGQAIQVDASGNVYTRGFFLGTPVDMDPGPGTHYLYLDTTTDNYNNFLSKLDVNGNFVAADTFNAGDSNVNRASLKLDTFENLYTTTSSELIKFDSSWNKIWSNGQLYYYTNALAMDNSGKIYTVGQSVSALGGGAAYVTKFDTLGAVIWTNRINGTQLDEAYSVATDINGNVFFSGILDIGISTVGSGANSFNITSNGGYDIIVAKIGQNVGVNEVKSDNCITISPNPFISQTTISFSEEQKNTSLIITDVLGNTIQQLTTNNKQLTLDMSNFAKGIYFVRIVSTSSTTQNIVNRKIIKN